MIKLIAGAMITLSFSIFGMISAAKLSKTAAQRAQLKRLAEEIREDIRFSGEAQASLIKRRMSRPEYSFLKSGELFADREDFKRYESFIGGLGTTDTIGQMEYCEHWEREFGRFAESARADFSQKGKLYNILGLLAGLAVTLIII